MALVVEPAALVTVISSRALKRVSLLALRSAAARSLTVTFPPEVTVDPEPLPATARPFLATFSPSFLAVALSTVSAALTVEGDEVLTRAGLALSRRQSRVGSRTGERP